MKRAKKPLICRFSDARARHSDQRVGEVQGAGRRSTLVCDNIDRRCIWARSTTDSARPGAGRSRPSTKKAIGIGSSRCFRPSGPCPNMLGAMVCRSSSTPSTHRPPQWSAWWLACRLPCQMPLPSIELRAWSLAKKTTVARHDKAFRMVASLDDFEPQHRISATAAPTLIG